MRDRISRGFVLGIVCALLVVGCGKLVSKKVDTGRFKGSVYENKYFGLSVSLPKDWSIQSRKKLEEAMDVGGRMMAGDDKNLQAVLKEGEKAVVALFGASKYALGTPVEFNPNIFGVAEYVKHMPGIKRAVTITSIREN